MRIFGLLLISIALLGAVFFSIDAERNTTGVFIGSAQDSAFSLRLIQGDDGSLSGQYREVALKQSGKLVERIAAVVGVTDKGMITVTIKSGVPLIPDVQLSGSFSGDSIHLSGAAIETNFVLNLVRSSDEGFSQQVATLQASAKVIKQRQSMSDAAKFVSDHAAKMREFSAHADTLLPKFKPIQNAMRAVTKEMERGLKKELSITGHAKESGHRDQVSVAINQIAIQGISITNNASTAYASFTGRVQNIRSGLTKATDLCVSEGTIIDNEGSTSDLAVACKPMLDAARVFEEKELALKQAYAKLGSVLNSETQAQNHIVQKADAAAN